MSHDAAEVVEYLIYRRWSMLFSTSSFWPLKNIYISFTYSTVSTWFQLWVVGKEIKRFRPKSSGWPCQPNYFLQLFLRGGLHYIFQWINNIHIYTFQLLLDAAKTKKDHARFRVILRVKFVRNHIWNAFSPNCEVGRTSCQYDTVNFLYIKTSKYKVVLK